MYNLSYRALSRLFPGFDAEIGDRVTDVGNDVPPPDPGDDGGDDGDTDEPSSPPLSGDDRPAALAAEAERLYLEAQDLLREGDLAGYEEKLDQVGDLIAQLADELDGNG